MGRGLTLLLFTANQMVNGSTLRNRGLKKMVCGNGRGLIVAGMTLLVVVIGYLQRCLLFIRVHVVIKHTRFPLATLKMVAHLTMLLALLFLALTAIVVVMMLIL
jgi:hypothetical protein